MNIQKLKILGKNKLIENNIEDASIKAEILLCYVLNMSKKHIIINSENEVPASLEQKYLKYIEEVVAGKPVQYITNRQKFMGLDFFVNENVLIPQPDTEILVEEALKSISFKIEEHKRNNTIKMALEDRLKDEKKCKIKAKIEHMDANRNDSKIECNTNKKNKLKILDLCTGSGAIAISIEQYLRDEMNNWKNKTSVMSNIKYNIEIWASDISKDALNVAHKNAQNNNSNIKFIQSNMFENIKEKDFDYIVSNPPYIAKKVIPNLSKEVQNEPHIALDGGSDGLDFYKIIASEGYKYVKSEGYIIVEIGYDQKESVINIFKSTNKYSGVECIKDLSGQNRVIKVCVN